MKKVVAGMDLHRNNVVIGIMDMDGKRVASCKVPCELKEVVKFLAPFKKRLEQVAVESTYNWYWLVDGLLGLKYPVVLANPAGMEQYNGIKHADTNDVQKLGSVITFELGSVITFDTIGHFWHCLLHAAQAPSSVSRCHLPRHEPGRSPRKNL
jgi:hypothetical protein